MRVQRKIANKTKLAEILSKDYHYRGLHRRYYSCQSSTKYSNESHSSYIRKFGDAYDKITSIL